MSRDNEHLTRRAAILAVGGKSKNEIARELGVSPGTVTIWQNSPLWTQLKEAYTQEIERRGIISVVEELQHDAPQNIQFIRDVRDGSFTDDDKRMRSRLSAAKMLLDKQVPNADIRAQNESAARIILDGKLLGQVLHALREVNAIDITPQEIDEATADTIQKVILPKTPEQFAADEALRAAETEDAEELLD